MNQFRFLEWEAYADSQELFTFIHNIVKRLPREYRFELGSQILRSASSVILNIAEGSGKESEKELNRFIETSLGSLYETLANLDILQTNKLIDAQEFATGKKKIASICNQLGGFKKTLRV